MQDFKLSAVLAGHHSDVRAVALPDPSLALTASRDGTTRVWKRTATSPPTYDATESSHGAAFKNCLTYVADAKGFPEGLIYSGGQDAIIEARQPSTTSEANADGLLPGHTGAVCALDSNPEAGWFVSGSWDKTAKVWQIGRWEPEVELQGHTASVWAVLAYSKDTIVTGCADRAIRVFDLRGKLQISFDGKEVVRALAKLPKDHKTGGDLASATNDGIIRIWTIKGELLSELVGHEAFIYSLAILPSGELISSGEDRTVRVWSGTDCVQVITLPAISVWTVAACPNGDFIVGSSDKVARIFTKDEKRLADPSILAQFDKQVQSSAIPEQQLGDINRTDAPGPDFLQRKSGTKEGQIQMIKELDGSMFAYQWSTSQQSWIGVGQVVGSAGTSTTKVAHKGKEYDYVFDIDHQDGTQPLKLPYNVTQNPHEAAMKFLQDNELPMAYLEETANFIVKNTQGASLGPSPQSGPPGSDPWGTESRYRPGDAPSYNSYQPIPSAPPKKLPHKDYISIVAGKADASQRQILKLNMQYANNGTMEFVLSQSELECLAQLFKQLESYKFDGPASLASTPSLEAGMAVAFKVATAWQPPSNRLAGLDLLRFLAASATDLPKFQADGKNVASLLVNSSVLDADMISSHPKLAMLALRFFVNMIYASKKGRGLLEVEYNLIVDHVKLVSLTAASDIAMAVAVTTFYLNLAVYNTSGALALGKETPDRCVTIVEELVKILSSLPEIDSKVSGSALQQATEPAYRGLVALGTVIVGLKSAEIIIAAKEIFNVPALLDLMKAKSLLKEPRFQPLVSEIKVALA